jgi:aminopeptidase N
MEPSGQDQIADSKQLRDVASLATASPDPIIPANLAGADMPSNSRGQRFPLDKVLPLILLVGLLATIPARATPVPLAPPQDASPVAPALRARQHRFAEAETKSRHHLLFKRAEAAKTPSMDLYDVIHYDLDLVLEPDLRLLSGTVTMTGRVTGTSLDTVDLDLALNMSVSAATAAGVATSFTHILHVLRVDLDRTYNQDEVFVVSVTYAGDPSSEAFTWSSFAGADWIWTLSEPYGARKWWPCKDVNSDKADSVDIRVTVPDNGLIVASNGLLVAELDNGDTRTFHWHESYPIATYLVSLAIHTYEVFSDWYHPATGDSMEVVYYVVPSQLANAQLGYPVTVDMLHAFAAGFGEYPFLAEKYGHAQFNWGGGMEHQTLTSLKYTSYSPWLLAHELAHQWWGDLVTCATFHHIWLNEGFATWSEAYWREQSEGVAAYHEEMDNAAYWGSGTIIVEDPEAGGIFNYWTSYAKASWVVHMLRHVLGDEDFFAALATYRQVYAYDSATTEQFRDVCEAVSGQDLDAFFQQWIYGEYFPQYAYAWYAQPAGPASEVNLLVEQQQTDTGLFTMPIDVVITTDSQVHTFVIQNSQAQQTYTLSVAGEVQSVQLDPDGWILATFEERVVDVPAGEVAAVRLLPNHPNPFNPATTLRFLLPRAAPVRLTLHDLAGRVIRTLAADRFEAGEHHVVWDGRDSGGELVASGIYFYRLEFPEGALTRKLTLLK